MDRINVRFHHNVMHCVWKGNSSTFSAQFTLLHATHQLFVSCLSEMIEKKSFIIFFFNKATSLFLSVTELTVIINTARQVSFIFSSML